MNFCDLTLPERIGYLLSNKDDLVLYDLIAKHLHISTTDANLRYKIRVDYIKNHVYISSDNPSYLFELFTDFQRFLTSEEFESITTNELRIDLHTFLNKIL